MNFVFTPGGVLVGRDRGDRALGHERELTAAIIRAFNRTDGEGCWRRFRPDRHGLSDCREGLINTRTGAVYWHGNYSIEAAHKAWNAGQVFFDKA